MIVERYSPEQPRAEAGTAAGGQFAPADSGKPPPRKKSSGSGTLGYDPKTGRGTGYGTPGGDERVSQLQEALNGLGLSDGDGKPLKVDGKLGPKTTAAVRKLQKQLGVTADGKVTPDLLKKILAMKAPAKTAAPANKSPAKAPAKKTAPAKTKAGPPPAKPTKKAPPADRGRMQARGGLVMPQTYNRTYPLEDIQIRRSGDGRTVEAYAACFDSPYEVRDEHGHYNEVINRAAFNRTLSGGAGQRAMCLYNHGMTVHGTPDGMASIPLGTPLEIRPDGRGLLTVTRYNRGPFADQVLEAIKDGSIKAQSFRGRIVRSDPAGRLPRTRLGAPLPTVTRYELGLTDYGPTPIPVNSGAEIVAVRSVQDLLEELAGLDPEDRYELLRSLDLEATPDGDPADEEEEDEGDLDEEEDGEVETATSDHSEPGAEDPHAARSAVHSGRPSDLRRRIAAAMVLRGIRT